LKSILNVLYRQAYFKKYDYGALRVNHEAKKTLSTADEPFFLFLNYMEPHLEYGPPKFVEEFVSSQIDIDQDPWKYVFDLEQKTDKDFEILQGLYDAELKYVDWRMGKILNRLKENNQYDNSIIIVTSDHGENIGEHGLMDHQYCLYNTLLHVPLIIKYPGNLQKEISDRITTPVSTLDLFPTICSVCGIDVENSFDGEVLPQRTESGKRYVVSEYLSPMPSVEDIAEQYSDIETEEVSWINRTIRSIQNNHTKYIQYDDGEKQLFNLELDPQENHNIIEQVSVEKIKKLENIIDNKTTDNFSSEVRDVSQETQDILSDLGYLN
jgi:arylsulfatase A-like enzyme